MFVALELGLFEGLETVTRSAATIAEEVNCHPRPLGLLLEALAALGLLERRDGGYRNTAFAALAPGGRIAIHDRVADPDAADPEFAAFFSLHVMIYSRGQVYTRAQYADFLRGAGFDGITVEELAAPGLRNPTSLITAVRPD